MGNVGQWLELRNKRSEERECDVDPKQATGSGARIQGVLHPLVHPIKARLAEVSPGGAAGARNPMFASPPAIIAASQMTQFTAALQAYTGRVFTGYDELHQFSVRDYRTFWRFFLDWSRPGLEWAGDPEPVCEGDECEFARFFPNLQLNYADNLLNLRVAPAEQLALTACHADGRRVRWTRGELRTRVARLAASLSALGLGEGDRVVGVMRNDADAIVSALAVAAVGATLSTASPDMGVDAILDRFGPLAPRLLFAHTAARAFDVGVPLPEKIAGLAASLPSLEGMVRLDSGALPGGGGWPEHSLDQLVERGDAARFVWRRFPFNHPLFIMFSSGTTGRPKCIIHGAGGSLLEHVKEHRLHTDLRPGDRMYFHTSCAWMMWNWQLSALASGVEIVTYDGPISEVGTLWRLVARERVNVFGTSPAYLKMCEDAGLAPGRQFDLGALRAMMSTGAVLYDEQFEWVREQVKPLPLQSISGGTDILGCFVLGNPNLPVTAGEAQCRSLGLDVQAWAQGKRADGVGELVCLNPFPSRPLGFLGDTSGAAFHAAYFAQNEGCWTHGDLIEFSSLGGARLHGRCDGVLNVRGIKIAPGEIYRVLRGMPEIREAMAVEQRMGHDQRMVLLLVLRDGVSLDSVLISKLRRELARRLSSAHVPDRILAIAELPATHNGKPSEAAARNAVNGLPIANAAALRNPACLEAIRSHPGLRVDEDALPQSSLSRHGLEQRLQAQWQKRFGFEPIGLDDNFFDLGGNSLLAVRLLADVRQMTGRTLALATMLAAPTIRALARVIEEGVDLPASPALVPMRPGIGAPLFLVHGLSGSVMECRPVISALRGPRPVYGLQARGLEGEQPPQDRVEDIAAGYVEQIRTVQASGPYALAGYSFGALVAFEMAQQLRRAGEPVQFLCLIDAYVEQDLPWSFWLGYRWERARRKAGQLTALQLVRYAGAKSAEIAGHAYARLTGADPLSRMNPAWRLVQKKMTAAMAAYRPQPYDGGPVVHIRAAVDIGEYYDPMPLWRQLARAGSVVLEVPGDHFEMVGANAAAVAAALERALAGG
jgi:acetoacetyl-CoA synthetase